jgi:solute carrier family 50 protein (sugar transporter)
VLGFGLGLLQMVVYAIYRNGGEKDISTKKEKKAPIALKSIVIETPQLTDKNDEQQKKSEEPIA